MTKSKYPVIDSRTEIDRLNAILANVRESKQMETQAGSEIFHPSNDSPFMEALRDAKYEAERAEI